MIKIAFACIQENVWLTSGAILSHCEVALLPHVRREKGTINAAAAEGSETAACHARLASGK